MEKRATKQSSSISYKDNSFDYTDKTKWKDVAEFHSIMSKKLADSIYYNYESEINNIINSQNI